MASSYEYILSLNDQMSGKLQQITGKSLDAANRFSALQDKTEKLRQSTGDFGNSITTLRQKIGLLQEERDLIDPKNLKDIRKYNSEINKLNKEITKLETVNGSKFKKYTQEAFGSLPPFLTNPVVMTTAVIGSTGKMAVGWSEGMAKINATAQLPQQELDKLSKKIKALGVDAGSDLARVPDAYEKILSQTGDVAVSTDILQSALKGAKAGFTDVDVVSGALAQTLSAVGKENTNAEEVINTLFAAKRVGAGEFKDFANYVPSLVSAASAVGMAWQDTAGMFAYMTGKGQDASSATMLIQNAFTALGKSDIQKAMQANGINIFDEEGNINAIENIMSQMNAQMAGMSDQQKSNFLETLGLRDAQAKNAFSVLSSDVDKLKGSLEAVRNPLGELDNALKNTENPANKIRAAWSKIQGVIIDVGGAVVSVLNPALDIALPLLTGVATSVGWIGEGLNWLVTGLQEGNPLIWALTAGLTTLTVAMSASAIAMKMQALWAGIVTGVTNVWTVAQLALNAAFWANPIVLIVAGVMALVGAIVVCISKVQGWGKQWDSVVSFIKLSIEGVKNVWDFYVHGFMIGINKIQEGWYKFKNSLGMGDEVENNAALERIRKDTEARKKGMIEAANGAVDSFRNAKDALKWELSWKKSEESTQGTQEKQQQMGVAPGANTAPVVNTQVNIPESAQGGSVGGQSVDLNNIKGSTNYGAIAAKLSGVTFSGLNQLPGTTPEKSIEAATEAQEKIETSFKQPLKTDYIKLISDNVAKIAASIAVVATVSTGTIRTADDSTVANITYAEASPVEPNNSGRSVRIDKFCDQIVINVPEGSDTDEIVRRVREEIFNELEGVVDYEA